MTMRNSTRLKRLRMLRDMLKQHTKYFPKEKYKFDMNSWKRPEGCRTAACALGSACMYPPFNKMGLTIYENTHWTSPDFKGQSHGGIDTGAQFFGITEDESIYLFIPEEYDHKVTPNHVAARVQELITIYRRAG